mmetsp:Transcript_67504/g.106907  ORF Transcript_67504/g.106907 Transcript_67504/m.106907 type:complete len:312 (-) Transcript_67504:2635-3570(-)
MLIKLGDNGSLSSLPRAACKKFIVAVRVNVRGVVGIERSPGITSPGSTCGMLPVAPSVLPKVIFSSPKTGGTSPVAPSVPANFDPLVFAIPTVPAKVIAVPPNSTSSSREAFVPPNSNASTADDTTASMASEHSWCAAPVFPRVFCMSCSLKVVAAGATSVRVGISVFPAVILAIAWLSISTPGLAEAIPTFPVITAVFPTAMSTAAAMAMLQRSFATPVFPKGELFSISSASALQEDVDEESGERASGTVRSGLAMTTSSEAQSLCGCSAAARGVRGLLGVPGTRCAEPGLGVPGTRMPGVHGLGGLPRG